MRRQRVWIGSGFDSHGKLARLEEVVSLKGLKRAIEQTVKSKLRIAVEERVMKAEKGCYKLRA